ncbi:MAG: hypothetical protein WC379_13345 [Methanoregula sp.]|jgi:hypothetical protein
MVFLLIEGLSGKCFLDLFVSLHGCNTPWSPQTLDVPEMGLSQLVKPDFSLFTAGIAAKEVEKKSPPVIHRKSLRAH